MTPAPFTIGKDQSLTTAFRLMREHHIRHLPVLEEGKLVGLVSIGDLRLMETLQDVRDDDVTVEEAMSQDPFAVGPATSLKKVAETMVAKKYGSAVVVENNKVVGVFTTIDALRALMGGYSEPGKRNTPSRQERRRA
jgi:acetoin utilization protein AcuB